MLWFFNFHRSEENNYRRMREYFSKILIMEIEEHCPLWDKKVLDVGGAQGEFCKAIHEKRRCRAVNLDPKPGDFVWPDTRVGFADEMPLENDAFDLVICRGVMEHVPHDKQQRSVDEMFRVTRPGGMAYILIPPWYNPHAGHTLKPFHVFPFKLAKFLRQTIFGDTIESTSFAESGLYPITFRRMLRLITASGFRLVATRDTHFRLHFTTKIPLLREIVVPAAAFLLKKTA